MGVIVDLSFEKIRPGQKVSYQNPLGEWVETEVSRIYRKEVPSYISLNDGEILDYDDGWTIFSVRGPEARPTTVVVEGWRTHDLVADELGSGAAERTWIEALF